MGDVERQDSDDKLVSLTSRLKLSFRSECNRQPILCFNKHNLPSELQELVLAHLPALKLAELKGISRSWRILLRSPRFKEKWQSIRGCSIDHLDVWVMKSMNEEDDLLAYIPSLNKYGPLLQLICIPLVLSNPYMDRDLRKRKCLCGSGSLFVFGEKDWQSKGFFSLYNLWTCQSQHLRRLPIQILNGNEESFSCILRPPVLIAADDHSQFILVVETSANGILGPPSAYELFVYKSTTASWHSYPHESAREAGFGPWSRIDFCQYNDANSTLYAWSEDHWYKVHVTFPIGEVQDVDGRGTASMQRGARAFKVFKCENHVLLITWLVQSVEGIVLQGFIVWKMVRAEESWRWAEISRTPLELCLKSYNEESLVPASFMSDGRRICAIASSHEFFPPLVYDVEHGNWYHLHGVLKNMQAFFTMKMTFNSRNL